MRKSPAMFLAAVAAVCGLGVLGGIAHASPKEDLQAFQQYFKQRLPDVQTDDFVNGPYAVDADMRKQWVSMNQFPPYSFALDEGEELFNTPFANGKRYADCFANEGQGIRQNYPYFDKDAEQVVTLELAVNQCRESNGEEPLPYKKGKMAAISAYMASTSEGNPLNIKIPDDPKALAAYHRGKKFYYERRGQLNFSCASCHNQNPGAKIRADTLAPGLGIVASFPIHRAKWGELGTLHRRFISCNRNVRSKPFPPQSETYRDLEYFLTYMSNGLPVAGPASRP